jgi:hypothetical protein
MVDEREVREKPVAKEVSKPVFGESQEVNREGRQTRVFRQALDVMSEDVGTSDIFDEMRNNPLQATFKGTSFVLSAGFLTWALRGASLLASVAATLPAWQGFDPMPVLASKKKRPLKDDEDDPEQEEGEDWQETRVRRLIDPIGNSGE